MQLLPNVSSSSTYTATERYRGTGAFAVDKYAGVNTFQGVVTLSVRKVNTVFDGRGAELVSDGGWIFDDFGNPSGTPSVSDGVLTLYRNNGGNFDRAYHEITTVIGGTYEWIVSNTGAVQVALNVGTSALGTQLYSANLNGATDSVVTFVATSTTTYVTLKPLGPTTTTQAGSVKQVLTPNLNPSADGQTYNYTAAGQNNDLTDHAFTASAWYRLSGYIENYSSGSLQIGLGDYAVQDASINSNGWFDVYLRATGAGALLRLRSAGGGATFDLSNFKSQEVPASVARAFYLDFDGADDNLILDADTIAASSNATLYKTFRGDTTDTRHMMFGTNGGPFILTAENNTLTLLSATSLGSPVYREDGSIAPYVTRSDVYTALIDNTDHTIGVEEADLSADATWTSSGFYIGGEHNTQWDSTGRLYSWAAVDTRLDGRGRDLLENFMLGKKPS